MKKIITIAALILFAVPAFAAIKPAPKGNIAVPASAANNQAVKGNFVITLPLIEFELGMGDLYESYNGDKRIHFSLGANGYESEVQYFVINSLAVGGNLAYSINKTGDNSEKTITFGPMANYYFNLNLGPIMPYAGCGFLFQNRSNDESFKDMSLLFQTGAVYMLGKNLSVYGELYLSIDNTKDGDSVSGQRLGIKSGVKAFF